MDQLQNINPTTLTGNYHWGLIILSYAVAVFASLTALYLVECIKESEPKNKKYWLLSLGFTLGGGIWSMHFIGMIAFQLPLPISYDLFITLLSLLISMAGAGFAIFTIHGKSFNKERIYLGALVLGTGIAFMHYTGMQAMIVAAKMNYDFRWVGLSIIMP